MVMATSCALDRVQVRVGVGIGVSPHFYYPDLFYRPYLLDDPSLNRRIRIKDEDEKDKSPPLDETNSAWVDSGDWNVYYRSMPVFREFAAGSE
jgi:hypothetical protein